MKKKQQEVKADLEAQTKNNPLEIRTPHQDITISFLDKHIDSDEDVLILLSTKKWYIRLWYLFSNPFCYIFRGYIRY